jgi:hypothetical protein
MMHFDKLASDTIRDQVWIQIHNPVWTQLENQAESRSRDNT